MIRIDKPATSTSTNQVAAKMIVCPRSGWPISSTAMMPVSTTDSGTTGRLWSCRRIERIHASDTAKKGLRNSDGWRRNMPLPIQRWAPFTEVPINGTRNRSARKVIVP